MKISFKNTLPDSEINFEFEGEWDTIKNQLSQASNYIEQLRNTAKSTATGKSTTKKISTTAISSSKLNSPKKASPTYPTIIPELLSKDEIEEICKFYNEKNPSSHVEIYAVFMYWLHQHKQIDSVHIDEIWTLYKIVRERPPKNLAQVFRDGKSKQGYFVLDSSTSKYRLTNSGEVFVEFDLPKKEKKNGNR